MTRLARLAFVLLLLMLAVVGGMVGYAFGHAVTDAGGQGCERSSNGSSSMAKHDSNLACSIPTSVLRTPPVSAIGTAEVVLPAAGHGDPVLGPRPAPPWYLWPTLGAALAVAAGAVLWAWRRGELL